MIEPVVDGLREDLRGYVVETPDGLALDHPLLHYYPVTPIEAGWIAEEVDMLTARLADAAASGDVYQWVMLHKRLFRLDAFAQVCRQLPDEAYWGMVRELWLMDDHHARSYDRWRALLTADRPGRDAMMREDELDALRQLGSPVHVWRPYRRPEAANGFDWVLEEEWAMGMCDTGRSHVLATGLIDRDSVIALLRGLRQSATVVLIDPTAIRDRLDVPVERRHG
jgi:hypothetical protein